MNMEDKLAEVINKEKFLEQLKKLIQTNLIEAGWKFEEVEKGVELVISNLKIVPTVKSGVNNINT